MNSSRHAKLSSRSPLKAWNNVPSARNVATAAGIVVTAVLMLELGIWYFVLLVALYAALDLTQRTESRRDARIRLAIMTSVGQEARAVLFVGPSRHCEEAAWAARRLGWLVCPIRRESLWRHSIRFKSVAGASPLSHLLEALNEERLATRIHLPDTTPSFGRRLLEQSYWEPARAPDRLRDDSERRSRPMLFAADAEDSGHKRLGQQHRAGRDQKHGGDGADESQWNALDQLIS